MVEDHSRSQGRNDGGSHAGTSTIGVIPAKAGMISAWPMTGRTTVIPAAAGIQ